MAKSNKSDIIKKGFIETYLKSMGNVSASCEHHNICRDTYYRWRKEDEDFAKQCDEAHERRGDYAESLLLQCMKQLNFPSIIAYLKYKHPDRGYVDRSETKTTEKVEVKLSENDRAIIDDYLAKSKGNHASS